MLNNSIFFTLQLQIWIIFFHIFIKINLFILFIFFNELYRFLILRN